MLAQQYFATPLANLPATEAGEMGILVPACDVGRKKIGITDQFLGDAESYARRYTDTGYFRSLIECALRTAHLESGPIILDIGSGAGNSVFPCLELFRDAKIVATDLSPNLLAIMKRYADKKPEWRDRIAYVCMDACDDYYRPGAFDLVIGAAILHHLINPATALHAAKRALRPGGVALFFEPFENGNAILRLAYEEILKGKAVRQLPSPVAELLTAMVEDYRVRAGSDKSDDLYRSIDDKWMFTRSYLERIANEAGFRQIRIAPIHSVERPFSRQTETNLRLGKGLAPEAMPDWAWEILGRYDAVFSEELRQDLLIEGSVILT